VRAAALAVGGKSFDSFFERHVHGTADLPLPALWRQAGLEVSLAPPWSAEAGEIDPVRRARARSWAGATIEGRARGSSERAFVKNVLPDSPAERAGLTYGDELVALDGFRVDLKSRLGRAQPGQLVRLSVFRMDELLEVPVQLAAAPRDTVTFVPDPKVAPAQLAAREKWLGARWPDE